jgi:TonB family protein
MAFLTLLAAAALPKLLNMPLNNADYPKTAAAERRSGMIRHQVTVGPDGKVRQCAIVQSSGYADFDQLTCASFKARARYQPATGDDGQPIFGVVTSASAWAIDGPPPARPMYADIELRIRPVAKLKLPALIGVVLTADATGKIANCSTLDKDAPTLDRVACDQAMRLSPLPAVLDDRGRPVPFVRNATIVFRDEAAQ